MDWEEKAKRLKADDDEDDKPVKALDEGDIALLQNYGLGPYSRAIKQTEKDMQKIQVSIEFAPSRTWPDAPGS